VGAQVRKAAAADVALAQGEAHSTAHRYLAAAAEFAKAVALFEDMHGVHARTHARTPALARAAPCSLHDDALRGSSTMGCSLCPNHRRRVVGDMLAPCILTCKMPCNGQCTGPKSAQAHYGLGRCHCTVGRWAQVRQAAVLN
jgi:hypothetical protein